MVEVGRDLKGRETKVRRWMSDRFLQNNFILYIWQLKLFYFYLSVNCLLLIFFCCLICVDFFCYPLFFWGFFCLFFLLYFALFFVIWGDWACLVISLLFIVIFLFFFNLIFFFTFMDFLGLFFVSWHFFTSSDRVPPGGGLHGGPVSGTGIEG